MNYFLVDFENVRCDGIREFKGVQSGDAFIIFYSDTCKSITIDVMETITQRNLKFKSFKVKTGTKNALDFQLSSYLGNLIGTENASSKFYIVSNDKGYDCLCDFWKEIGFSVERVLIQELTVPKIISTPKNASKTTKKEKKIKIDTANLATLGEIKKYLSSDDMVEEVLAIFNQYKTKQAICNGISKKCKDSKRAGSIYKKLKPLLKDKKKS